MWCKPRSGISTCSFERIRPTCTSNWPMRLRQLRVLHFSNVVVKSCYSKICIFLNFWKSSFCKNKNLWSRFILLGLCFFETVCWILVVNLSFFSFAQYLLWCNTGYVNYEYQRNEKNVNNLKSQEFITRWCCLVILILSNKKPNSHSSTRICLL